MAEERAKKAIEEKKAALAKGKAGTSKAAA